MNLWGRILKKVMYKNVLYVIFCRIFWIRFDVFEFYNRIILMFILIFTGVEIEKSNIDLIVFFKVILFWARFIFKLKLRMFLWRVRVVKIWIIWFVLFCKFIVRFLNRECNVKVSSSSRDRSNEWLCGNSILWVCLWDFFWVLLLDNVLLLSNVFEFFRVLWKGLLFIFVMECLFLIDFVKFCCLDSVFLFVSNGFLIEFWFWIWFFLYVKIICLIFKMRNKLKFIINLVIGNVVVVFNVVRVVVKFFCILGKRLSIIVVKNMFVVK